MHAGFVMDSPVGRLRISTREGCLVGLDYGVRAGKQGAGSDPLHKFIEKQILAYFADPLAGFSVPLELQGTPFQQKVWRALLKIPVGKTLSYGELAGKLHTSARAVGNACRANPIPLIVPCHRIVASNGIGGFSGVTRGGPIARKRWLLQHEGAI